MAQDIFYADLPCKNTGFDLNYEAVENSIRNILLTPVGSVPAMPTFGSKITSLIFSGFNSNTIDVFRAEVKSSIELWEKRISIRMIDVVPRIEYHIIEIKVFYNIKIDNDTTTRVVRINIKNI